MTSPFTIAFVLLFYLLSGFCIYCTVSHRTVFPLITSYLKTMKTCQIVAKQPVGLSVMVTLQTFCVLLEIVYVCVCGVYSLMGRCPPWNTPGAGRRTASPRCGATPAQKVRTSQEAAAIKKKSKHELTVFTTWWSLSFSSQMILCTWLLLSFFTVCTSAEVDRCCSQKTRRQKGCQSEHWANEHMSMTGVWGGSQAVTWTRLSVSRRKLKSPNRKKGRGV